MIRLEERRYRLRFLARVAVRTVEAGSRGISPRSPANYRNKNQNQIRTRASDGSPTRGEPRAFELDSRGPEQLPPSANLVKRPQRLPSRCRELAARSPGQFECRITLNFALAGAYRDVVAAVQV